MSAAVQERGEGGGREISCSYTGYTQSTIRSYMYCMRQQMANVATNEIVNRFHPVSFLGNR